MKDGAVPNPDDSAANPADPEDSSGNPADPEPVRWRMPDWVREVVLRDLLIAAVVGISTGLVSGAILANQQKTIDDARSDREQNAAASQASAAERLENLRFVRDPSSSKPEDAEQRPFAGLDLRGQQLAGLKLANADFTGADLRGADLTSTDLTNANLRGAKAEGASFHNAILEHATMDYITVPNADFTGARMESVWASHAIFNSATFTEAQLSEAHFSPSAEFMGATFYRAVAEGTDFADAKMANAAFKETHLEDAVFEDADLSSVRMSQVNASGAHFAEATMTGTRIRQSNLLRADFRRTRGLSADNLSEVNYGATLWPDGFTPPENLDCGDIVVTDIFGYHCPKFDEAR